MSADTAAAEVPSNVTRIVILVTVSLCTMLYALTATIINVALPQLQGALSATPDQIAWVVSLNIVATAVATPMTGWLVAKFGQRQVLLWCVFGFAVASFMCSTAETLAPLLAYRVAQGALGAPLVPLSQAILLATFTGEDRAMAQGIFGMSVVVGPALGPVIGGYLAEAYDWRWIFYLIIPLAVTAFILVLLVIRDGGRDERHRFDWTGFLALSLGLACLQLMVDRGERFGWFESTEIIVYASMMGLGFWIFGAHTATHPRPFVNPQLFRDRNFVLGVALVFVYGMLNFTPITLLPPMLQGLKGYPDSLIGTLLAMRGAGMVVGFFLAGRLGRADPRIGIGIGLAYIGMSGAMMATFEFNTAPYHIAWAGIIQGIGSGIMWVPLTMVAFATLEPRLLPDGSAIYHLLRNFGSSIFIGISFMTVVRTSKINYSELVENVNPFNEMMRNTFVTGAWTMDTLPGIAALSEEASRQAQMIGYSNAFVLYALVCFVTLPLVLFVQVRRA